MKKRAVILHGTDGAPEHNWFPWLSGELQQRGYEVWVPSLPNNHTPDRRAYNDFLFGSGWDFADNLVIGHSSGAVSILNLLTDNRCPAIKTAVLVGAWATCEGTDLPPEQFKDLFPEGGFDFETITSKAETMLFIHGDDDPFCPLPQAQWLAEQTKSELVVVPKGHHLGNRFNELPVVLQELDKRSLL